MPHAHWREQARHERTYFPCGIRKESTKGTADQPIILTAEVRAWTVDTSGRCHAWRERRFGVQATPGTSVPSGAGTPGPTRDAADVRPPVEASTRRTVSSGASQ